MLMGSAMPYITFLMTYISYKAKIFKDKGYRFSGEETKALTIQQYVNMYRGPEVSL